MNVDKPEALRRSPLFEMLSPAELGVLGDLSRTVRFAPGEALVTEGEAGASLYVLVAGEVDVLRTEGGQEKVIATLRAPSSLGEMSLIDRDVRSATIRARGECLALQLTAENFASFRKRSRDGFTFFVINVARVLSARLREMNRKLASRL
jgi:CRP-like cAMP-binding protein